VTAVLDRAKPTSTGPPPRDVVRVLAFREARWILRHPLFLLGVVATGVLVWKTTAWWHAPVLHRDDARLAGCMLPLAATTMIVCNLAAFRARRHGTEEIEDVAPTPQSRRTVAHLTAFTAPVLVACLLAVAYVAFLYAIGGVWRPSVQELATGPAIVALAAAAGVALARWIPSPIAGTLGLLGLVAFQMLGSSLNGNLKGLWFAPFVDAGNENRIPETVFRPAGWHLVYLLGLATLFAAIASLRHGRSPRRFAAIGLALSVLVVGGVMQSRPIDRQLLAQRIAMVRDPAASQHCETRGTVTFCVFPAYREWIDGWDETVRRVLAPVPTEARPRITIRQALYADELEALVALGQSEEERIKALHETDKQEPEPSPFEITDDVILRVAWARGHDERASSFDLAVTVARRVIGVSERVVTEERRYTPADIDELRRGAERDAGTRDAGLPSPSPDAVERPIPKLGDTHTVEGICWTAGQAREAIALWLAGRAVPGAVSLLATPAGVTEFVGSDDRLHSFDAPYVDRFSGHGSNFLSSGTPPYSPSGIHAAIELISRFQQERVAETLSRGWRSWIDPATPHQQLQTTFGLSAPRAKPRGLQLPMLLPPTCR
jgi:hypothetical protein